MYGCTNTMPQSKDYKLACESRSLTYTETGINPFKEYSCYKEVEGIRTYYTINRDINDMYVREVK